MARKWSCYWFIAIRFYCVANLHPKPMRALGVDNEATKNRRWIKKTEPTRLHASPTLKVALELQRAPQKVF